MNYFQHLIVNWKLSLYALNSFIEHFLHGLIPFIHWYHTKGEQ